MTVGHRMALQRIAGRGRDFWGCVKILPYHPIRRAYDWSAIQFHLRRNKVYGAELYDLRQALRIFDDRGERGQRYTIFADSASAIDRAASGMSARPLPVDTTSSSRARGYRRLS